VSDDKSKRPSRIDPRSESRSSATDERDLLIAVITKAATEYGYDALTVEFVVRRAGLTEAAFYEHFADMRRSLLVAQDRFFERFWTHVMEACDAHREWPAQVRAALDAAIDFLAEAPAYARVFAIEAAAAGPVATERQLSLIERLSSRLREGRANYPDAATLPQSTEQAVIGGIASLISGHLLAEEAYLLHALEPELLELLLTPYLGRSEARRRAQA